MKVPTPGNELGSGIPGICGSPGNWRRTRIGKLSGSTFFVTNENSKKHRLITRKTKRSMKIIKIHKNITLTCSGAQWMSATKITPTSKTAKNPFVANIFIFLSLFPDLRKRLNCTRFLSFCYEFFYLLLNESQTKKRLTVAIGWLLPFYTLWMMHKLTVHLRFLIKQIADCQLEINSAKMELKIWNGKL